MKRFFLELQMVVAVEENCNTTGFRLRESQHNRKTTLRIHLR